MNTSLTFRFSGKIARLLGRESVSNEIVALFELVKNSYDADATKVQLSFKNLKTQNPSIVIKDDGIGMTYEDFRDRWMVVGTENKERSTVSTKGRRVVGEKGVGRFATEKLAKQISIKSYPIDRKEKIVVKVNWEDYEKEGAIFDEIPNSVIVATRESMANHGLEIILEGLRDKWTVEKIERLSREVVSLLSPPLLSDVTSNFNVELNAPDFNIVNKVLENAVLSKAPFIVKATTVGQDLKCTILDEERNRYERSPHKPMRKPMCGPIAVQLFIFPLDVTGESNWKKYYQNNLEGIKINKLLSIHAGVKIYRDGFWIKPYGGIGNDWLELDKMRVSRHTNVGNGQVIGFVRISRDANPNIIDTTTRERLIDNDAYNDMRSIVIQTVKEFNYFREERKEETQKIEPQISKDNLADNNLKYLQEKIVRLDIDEGEKKEISKAIKNVKENLESFAFTVTEELGQKSNEIELQRSIVTVGIATAYISHEIIKPLTNTIEILNSVQALSNKDSVQVSMENLRKLQSNTSKLLHYMSFVRDYVSNISQSINNNWLESDVVISDLWNDILLGFKDIIDEMNVEVILYEPNGKATISINSVNMESILINLFTNSIRALRKVDRKRLIKLEVKFENDHFLMTFSDNGVGIDESNRYRIFEPLFSTYETRDGEVHGTGLGLPLIREIIKEYDGTIRLSTIPYLGEGTSFIIDIPLTKVKEVI